MVNRGDGVAVKGSLGTMFETTEFPKARLLRCVRWVYDHTFATCSLLLWTNLTGWYFGLDFCKGLSFPVTPSGRGLSKPLEMKRLRRRGLVTNHDILLVGAGKGAEIVFWSLCKPRSVVAVELKDYMPDWKCISRNVTGTRVCFTQSDARSFPFRDASFDFLASFTVLEHLSPLTDHVREVHRVLRPGGHYYAVVGPLWPTFGGCHVNSLAYNHLLVSEQELLKQARGATDGEREWLESGLLNRCGYDDYVRAFEPYFRTESEAWVISALGIRFRRENPVIWERLRKCYTEKDLLLSSVNFLFSKKC